jgi:predicted alpha/beta hydrolase family esterase
MPKRITLILPGFSNSGPEHWQSQWERIDPSCRRVEQAEWEAPRCADWVATLDEAISSAAAPVVLVAHSSSCAMVAHWARDAVASQRARVRGALLVAPSDPEGPSYPLGPTGFAPMPLDRLPFRSIVVASTNDIYVTAERAREYAVAWGSELVDVGAAGHINAASGLADWPFGRMLLARLHESPEESAAISR